MNIRFIDSINAIAANDWRRLNNTSSPFLTTEFFNALESSGSTSSDTGWTPHHLVIENKQEITALMPLYIKDNSWGEYVFDWSWAEAYASYGYNYYPKLVASLPFTPISTDKLLSTQLNTSDIFQHLINHCQQENINSWHMLYCPELSETESAQLEAQHIYQRNSVQFHWFNRNYDSFDHYLEHFNSRKRKNTRKERQAIIKQNIEIRRVLGPDISKAELDFFYLTYQLTYVKRGHSPHLSFQFFQEILQSMANNILLIIASVEQEYVACAWFFYDEQQLYGRYWGCTKTINYLHFELCYYQGIEFCLEQGLQCFNPGTQGEHKIQRGFEPVLTHSYHWLKNPSFRPSVKEFCLAEQKKMQHYLQQCQQALPFKDINLGGKR